MVENGDKTINLHPLWDALLQVYQVVADICNRHSLRYCASYGTALGAVRHGGFIPWDDDLDIEMPRPDYERFIEIAKIELPDGYVWLDRFNCSTYDNPFGKVIVSDIRKVDRVSEESGISLGYGIFIDIFPVDGMLNTKLGKLWRNLENILVETTFKASLPRIANSTWRGKIAAFLGKLIPLSHYRVNSHREQCDFYENRARKIPFGSTEMCVPIGGAHYSDYKAYPLSFWNDLKLIPFENTQIPVFGRINEYLSLKYGDFMKLPPLEKRKGTHGNVDKMPWRLGP